MILKKLQDFSDFPFFAHHYLASVGRKHLINIAFLTRLACVAELQRTQSSHAAIPILSTDYA
jgi:hypothetical protein